MKFLAAIFFSIFGIIVSNCFAQTSGDVNANTPPSVAPPVPASTLPAPATRIAPALTTRIIVPTPGKDKSYWINGISTAEDIGGVEVWSEHMSENYYYLAFENFNNFPVTVIFEFSTRGKKQTGVVVLKPNEKKSTKDDYYYPNDYKLIVRKLQD